MSISEIDGCSQSHWKNVREIIQDSIADVGFKFNLVSEAGHTGVILKQIVQNLYDNPILICDVSGKNPNIMLEFVIRLAFDKLTVIIKDDCTDY